MQYEDFLGRTIYPGVETVYRRFGGRETLPLVTELASPVGLAVGGHVGGFGIDSVLGGGVTSTVYGVTDLATGKKLALKLLRVRDQESLATSRLGHRRIMPLSHPSLVKVHGMHLLEGFPAISMERVEGVTLAELIRSLSGDRVAAFRFAEQVARDIGGALQMLHSSGLVHRDIKPDNLLLDDGGRIRLIDYGLVGSYDPEADPDARRSYLAGTFWYMAPESICSQRYPPACDIYALGCVLLELIADPSRLPEPTLGKSLGKSVAEIERVIPVDTPEELRELIRDMLDPNSENRPLAACVARVGDCGHAGTPIKSQIAFRPVDLLDRDLEMRQAESWFHDVARHGHGWLHISGPSGCGKSWFASEMRRRISTNRWFQVFDAACLATPLEGFCAFDEIIDLVARRYARDDRGSIVLSPAATSTILWLFPALRSVIDSKNFPQSADSGRTSCSERSIGGESTADALASMTELFNRLCDYGPVMLVIDNFHWVDRGTVDLLNRLLSEVDGAFGLVTVSQVEAMPHFCKPNMSIRLRSLDDQQSIRLVENMMGYGVPKISRRLVEMIASSGRGNANDLCQMLVDLAAESTIIQTDQPPYSIHTVSRLEVLAQISKKVCATIRDRVARSIFFT